VLAQRVVVHGGEVAGRVVAGVAAQVDMGACQARHQCRPGQADDLCAVGDGSAAARTARIRPSSITTAGSVVSEGLAPPDIAAARRTASRRALVWVCSAIGGTVRPPGMTGIEGSTQVRYSNFSAPCPAARMGL
jgi:hypothetical protein